MNHNFSRSARMAGAVVAAILVILFGGLPAQTQEKGARSKAILGGNTMTDTAGFYCNAKALNKTERARYSQLSRQLGEARMETKELSDGYAFRLKSETTSLPELAEWISYERKCCPFFSFEIELQRDSGPLWLTLTGREGVKVFLRSEFEIR